MNGHEQNTQDEQVEAHRRRFAGGAPAENPADVEGHPARRGPEADAAEVEGHPARRGPEADAADVEAHGLKVHEPAEDPADN